MAFVPPIGVSDFKKLREKGLTYVDKTRLLLDLIDRPGLEVVLFPRPRRFGKTLNLSMLRYFFEKSEEDRSALFEGLEVFEAGPRYRAHFGRYPVVFLSFREVKATRWDDAWAAIQRKIRELFDEHRGVLDHEAVSRWARSDYEAILDGTADRVSYERALGDLTKLLHAVHGERAMVLVDEYDEPIHAGHAHGYAREVLGFFRAFLTAGLEDNPHLERGVLTGVLRVAKESIFSGLNNLSVMSLLERRFSSAFGFTDVEVARLLTMARQTARAEEIREWYDGYLFGERVVYNPWSVLQFLAAPERGPQPYWLSTSSNELIEQVLRQRAPTVAGQLETLLEGGEIEVELDEHVVLGQLASDPHALWSLLTFSGYLRARSEPVAAGRVGLHRVAIPNREVRLLYASTFRRWIEDSLGAQGGSVTSLTAALLEGDAEGVEEQLRFFVASLLSYYDRKAVNAEVMYHGLVVGLLATLEPGHRVRSNRESGAGRPDVLVIPQRSGGPGVVLELKVARRGRSLDQALADGLGQLEARDYAAELRAAGAEPIHAFAVAFDGREVRVARSRCQ
ncbi:AAA family ATPase [Paraliomyxa miuraensis]|uniref:AAA family ATPase n=1 Tax=Paraliomyxa miuraensis TaxID=376150 RepID=UPI002254D9BF|nr:AAA family ATPase [Paraliomyxa miuraensis]MCX4244161.1 ATP-binding protein [Paraliomyxa miuraensis]